MTKPKAERVCGACDYFAQCPWLKRLCCAGGFCWHLQRMTVASNPPIEKRCFTPIGGRKAKAKRRAA